ncbi:MAG: AMP-binding protein [Bacteroidales bacterium]|nr:AMP-binding protein [Bacteroidales bacterium]MCF8387677.1 AMP-binding protein [Bacteroidales bacterium]MCF8398284.1 AMP-binding protein [Bacteroidales bacterium]
MEKKALNTLFAESIRDNWDYNAFSDYQGEDYQYADVAKHINMLHALFSKLEIRKGDKIALLGNNSSKWGMTYLAIMTYGAVIVPILPDFSTSNIHHIVNHSDAKLLFVSQYIFDRIEPDNMRALLGMIRIEDQQLLSTNHKTLHASLKQIQEDFEKKTIQKEDIAFMDQPENETCMISYTSGTTGFTKGVMLPRRSIFSNIQFAQDNMPLKPGNRLVSFLPMAHSYGMLFEFLFPFTLGCHITFLTKIPSPNIVTKAFGEIKPHLILSVPLVIEKIYKKRILPGIDKPLISFLRKVPFVSRKIYDKVNKKLSASFGNAFKEVVIGGAPMSEEVENFFKKIGFKYTIGYGMTECGPLISYAAWNVNTLRSSGRVVDRMEIRIDKQSKDKVGEIQVQGDNLMLGYYKNTEASKEAFTKDGWLKTGDLGYLDEEGFLFIKGRSKNLILGPSGKNIFPEEIEARICNLPCVQECVVKEKEGKLIALVYPDCDAVDHEGLNDQQVNEVMEKNRLQLNEELAKWEQIAKFQLVDEEFRKTPKRNIKRYLYS